jgi:hypothetical protein
MVIACFKLVASSIVITSLSWLTWIPHRVAQYIEVPTWIYECGVAKHDATDIVYEETIGEGFYDEGRVVVGDMPAAWKSLHGRYEEYLNHQPADSESKAPYEGVIFMHWRQCIGHQPILVVVSHRYYADTFEFNYWTAYVQGGKVVISDGRWLNHPMHTKRVGLLRFYAGQLAAADESQFSFRYSHNKESGVVIGRLLESGKVTFEVHSDGGADATSREAVTRPHPH